LPLYAGRQTIAAVRDRTHWNSPNIKPRHPVGLGLCTIEELDQAIRHTWAKRPVEGNNLGNDGSERLET
jgi:hypothetical protein